MLVAGLIFAGYSVLVYLAIGFINPSIHGVPEVYIPVHSNTSGENHRLIIIFLFSKRQNKRFILFMYFFQEKEGWAAERSHSETNVVSARHNDC